jgi:hypothetical protein
VRREIPLLGSRITIEHGLLDRLAEEVGRRADQPGGG